jgi:heme exporter protein A
MPSLHIRNLTIGHGQKHQSDDGLWLGLLIKNLSFTVNQGQIVWVSGENGIGKTTLLRTISGLHKPWSGQLVWNERQTTPNLDLGSSETEPPPCHYLGPRDAFHSARKLKDELEFQVSLMGSKTGDLKLAIQTLGLENLLELPIAHLSSGQRQRAAFARVLACKRSLWLLDEPLSALDTQRRALITSLIETHLEEGGIAIVTGHDHLDTAFRVGLNRLTLSRNPEAWQWEDTEKPYV